MTQLTRHGSEHEGVWIRMELHGDSGVGSQINRRKDPQGIVLNLTLSWALCFYRSDQERLSIR